jgi:hypothetical protein
LAGNNWNMYPNPVNDILFVEIPEGAEIRITDMTGKTVRTEFLKAGKNELNVSLLTRGVYMICTDSGTTRKFVKE